MKKTHLGPRSFFESFIHSLMEARKEVGIIAYVPWLFFLLVLFPSILIFFYADSFDEKLAVSEVVNVLSAFAVISGILCAFSISAMSQIQQLVSAFPFSDYLKEENLLDSFIFFPQYTFFVQFISIAVNSISIIFVVLIESRTTYVLVLNLGVLVYVSQKTFGLVDLIRRLTWHYSEYNIELNKE